MGGTSHLFLRVCDSSATWLFRRSSIAIRRSLSVVRLWSRPVSFADFFQIGIFESYPTVSLLSVIALDHKASRYVPSVLVTSSIRLLCFRSTHVEAGFVRESIEPFHSVLVWLRRRRSITSTRSTTYSTTCHALVPPAHP